MLCDGTAVSRTTYADLFTSLATTWGVGDGSTTFNLPDLRGMFLRGTGSHGLLNMADGNDFAGPAVGASENDQIQGFAITSLGVQSAAGGANNEYVGADSGTPDTSQILLPGDDGTYGTPRTGDETKPVSFGIQYIVKT